MPVWKYAFQAFFFIAGAIRKSLKGVPAATDKLIH